MRKSISEFLKFERNSLLDAFLLAIEFLAVFLCVLVCSLAC